MIKTNIKMETNLMLRNTKSIILDIVDNNLDNKKNLI